MIKVIIKRPAKKFTTRPEVRTLGKAGRIQRIRAKNRWKTHLKNAVKPRSNVESAVNLANILQRHKPLIDVANYNVFRGKTKPNHVRAKQPPQMRRR